jgi:hypothetical protein
LLNSEFLKYGAANLEGITAIHMDGDFDSVLELLQGQVTSDCSKVTDQLGQTSSLCDEKGFILCNFDIIFDRKIWLIIIDEASKNIFLDEMAKFLPFYKVSPKIINAQTIGISRKKNDVMLPDEHIILQHEDTSLSLIINKNGQNQYALDQINHSNWCINRKIMNDHQIIAGEMGKYRPHEVGQCLTRVSFKKGCFKGQEIIARMEYLGKLKKETRLIIYPNKNEISQFSIIGQTYQDQGNFFSSCLGKIDNFS